MFSDCHVHMLMNAQNYGEAVCVHKDGVNDEDIRGKLAAYQAEGILYLRDGGDALSVSKRAKVLAPEYGITYRTPIFAIHKNGHYGSIVGYGFDDMREYHQLVKKAGALGADFIKIMVSGIMDFAHAGAMTEPSLTKEEMRQMIHIAHEEGFAVMAHVNGPGAILDVIDAGVDSVEHGNFIDDDGLQALKESGAIWVPTFVTITNLIGSGRYDDDEILLLKKRQGERIKEGFAMGVPIAPGSDAGAYRVKHAQGSLDEYRELYELCKDLMSREEFQKKMDSAANRIRQRFQRESLNL